MQTTIERKRFLGPVFIVGMPRSGTTLMRALLNQHPGISLALTESHFIPYFIKTFGDPPALHTQAQVERFIKRFHQTVFYQHLSNRGYTFTAEDLSQHARLDSWASIFECILRHFSPKSHQENAIWGDKTPGYLQHIALLKQLYPEAKFLHIIRDPRDYCLSARQSWGKSIYRAAHRWQATLSKARQMGRTLEAAYLEVTYESLLGDTEHVMGRIADFLECDYHSSMVQIGLSPEDTGSTTGKYGIVKDNTHKYHQYLSQQEIKRIEEIACNCLAELDYEMENDVTFRPLNQWELLAYKLYDGIPTLKHHIFLSKSVVKGVKRLFNHYSTSSWR
jgi:Sulfotransferase family